MQTFLPYASFKKTASVLDRQRLGKQRVETLQIMKALQTGKGWVNHPATKMWENYERSLMMYQYAICEEWTKVRGYKDTCLDKTWALLPQIDQLWCMDGDIIDPPWLGDADFHERHRSMLMQKDPEFYVPKFAAETREGLEYKWPTREVETA